MAQQLNAPLSRGRTVASKRISLGSRVSAGWAIAAFVLLTSWTVGVGLTEREGFVSPLWHFAYAVGWSGVAVAYPFVVLLPVVIPFSQELSARWIFYSATRMAVQTRLWLIAWRNAWVSFIVFASYVMVTFIIFYYVIPAAGMTYDPTAIVGVSDVGLARLTGLIEVHPLVYAAAYSTWQGANAAVWATVGYIAVLVIRHRILAFAAPFAIFAVLSILMGLGGPPFAWNTPWLMWILFSVSAVPFESSITLLACTWSLALLGLAIVIKKARDLGALR